MHRDFRMGVGSEQLRAFDADGLVAKRRAFRGTSDDPDMLRYSFISELQSARK